MLIDHGMTVDTDSAEFSAGQVVAGGTAEYMSHELAEHIAKGTSTSTTVDKRVHSSVVYVYDSSSTSTLVVYAYDSIHVQ